MRNNKLLQVIASLTKQEGAQFRKYVRHGLFNSQEKIIVFIDYLTKNIAKYSAGNYEELRQKAFKKVYPKTAYNSLKMSRLSTAAFDLLNGFLVLEELKLEKKREAELLRKSYQRRRLGDLYLTALEQAVEDLNKQPIRDFYYCQEITRLQHDLYFNVDENKFATKDLLGDLIRIHQDLDAGYLLAKLHYACQVSVIQRLRGQSAAVPFIDEVLLMAKDAVFEHNPLMQVYLLLWDALKEPNEAKYLEVKGKLQQCSPLVNKEFSLHLLVLLINLSWLSVERSRWPQVVFDLYEYGLEKGTFLENGVMSSIHFNNFVDLGCSLGKFDRIRLFVKTNLPHLDIGEELGVNVKMLFEAFLYFGEKQYDKALFHLNFIEFKDYSYGLRAYVLVIKSLYETKKPKGYEEIETRCDSFMQYLKRKHKQGFIGPSIRKENLNFIKIVRQLPYASTSKFAKINTKDLREKMLGMEGMISRSWLLEKIEEL